MLYQGSDFGFTIRWWQDAALTLPIDFTSIKCQIRDKYGNLTLDVGASFIQLSSNVATVLIPGATVRGIRAGAGYTYDVFGTQSSQTKKLLRGSVTVVPETSAT